MNARHLADVALATFRREPFFVAMIVLAIGLGIGASVAMVAVLRTLTADPVPTISGQLHVPYFDASPPGFAEATQSQPGDTLTWIDAHRLLEAGQASHQSASASSMMRIRPDAPALRPFHAKGRLVTWQFFPMFETPFREGAPWTPTEDAQGARVVVLNGRLARRLFGNDPALGRQVRMEDRAFTVVGVLDDWYPRPLFHAGIRGDAAFSAVDDYFVPLRTALHIDAGFAGGMTCWSAQTGRTGDGCAWLQFWVRLPTAQHRQRYATFLAEDRRAQQSSGRVLSNAPSTLLDFDERTRRMRWVSADIALQTWLAFGLLGACIANAAALMMVRTLRRRQEIGIRRAIGASASDIRRQLGAEAAAIGIAAGLLGAATSAIAIRGLRARATAHADLVHWDASLVMLAILAAVAATVLASLMSIARAARVAPADMLRAQ